MPKYPHCMDFHTVVSKYGEEMVKQALIRIVSRIRHIIEFRTESAINGVLVMSHEEIEEDARFVAIVLEDFPFELEAKFTIINKAWEIVGP